MGKSKTEPSNTAATAHAAAYHAGPPEIEFAGRRWLIGVTQPVNADEIAAIQARPDAAAFDFTFTEE